MPRELWHDVSVRAAQDYISRKEAVIHGVGPVAAACSDGRRDFHRELIDTPEGSLSQTLVTPITRRSKQVIRETGPLSLAER